MNKLIKKTIFAVLVSSAVVAAAPGYAASGESKPGLEQTVQFKKGSTEASYKGTVEGYDYHSYTFNAKKGQILNLLLDTPANAEAVLFGHDDYPGEGDYVLPEDGKYEVRVLQMRNFARDGKKSPYTLTIELNDKVEGINGSGADDADIQDLTKVIYQCKGNQKLEVVYVNTASSAYAIIQQMDEMIPLEIMPSASGAVYTAMDQNYSYKLYSQGETAELVEANDKPVLSACHN